MSQENTQLRMDWFDGSMVEVPSVQPSAPSSHTVNEDTNVSYQRRPMGFLKILEISKQKRTQDNSHFSEGFWVLLNENLKGDYIVLLVKIFSRLFEYLIINRDNKVKLTVDRKLFKTKFLESLMTYLIELPSTRHSEKQRNSLFWNEVDDFLFDVITVCEGCLYFRQNENAQNLCMYIEICIQGLEEHQMEIISDRVKSKLNSIQNQIKDLSHNNSQEEVVLSDLKVSVTLEPIEEGAYPKIFPSKEELLNEMSDIKPHIINGAYKDPAHYLEIQYKLLREDFIQPLRDGIAEWKKYNKKKSFDEIRVTHDVRVETRKYRKGKTQKIDFVIDVYWKQRRYKDNDKIPKLSNPPMGGALILLTDNINLDNLMFATVLNDSFDPSQGYIPITFHTFSFVGIFNRPLIMIETEVYFEPYHKVLKALKSIWPEELPLKNHIVYVQKETQPPSYLSHKTLYTTVDGTKTFPVMNTNEWPPAQYFGLDQSQLDAMKSALTKSFAVIQGPPGTGKTHTGLKITEMLLKNAPITTPIIVICLTNHALDSYLEGVLKYTKDIVRIGSQSKNKNLDDYNFNEFRSRNHFYVDYSTKELIKRTVSKMTEFQTVLSKCSTDILEYKCFKSFMSIDGLPCDRHINKDMSLCLFCKECNVTTSHKVLGLKREVAFNGTFISIKEKIKDTEVKIKKFNDTLVGFNLQDEIKSLRMTWDLFCKARNGPEAFATQFQEGNTLAVKINNYFVLVNIVKTALLREIKVLQEKQEEYNDTFDDDFSYQAARIMKSVKVIGVTTSGAASRYRLLRSLQASIVIVEEASEVLESHVISALTKDCKHLILIGDHKQLRPQSSSYQLGRQFNLEVSLFERMVINDFQVNTLTTQRRMREEFASLLTPMIYKKLDNHECVKKYQDVRGMDKNFFFFTHTGLEVTGQITNRSCKNPSEAEWCAALAYYLVATVGHMATDVTIIATYAAQVDLIRGLTKNFKQLNDVRVTSVDNYQGEENKIIILSLVRSNRKGQVGFLKSQNRICVAMSRAKEGFYIFGNMDILKRHHQWKKINIKLIQLDSIGTELKIKCVEHSEQNSVIKVKSPKQLYSKTICPDYCLYGMKKTELKIRSPKQLYSKQNDIMMTLVVFAISVIFLFISKYFPSLFILYFFLDKYLL